MKIEGVKIETVNYSGHEFSDFFVQQSPGFGPGWFVFGRNSEKYGTKIENGREVGFYSMVCAYPDRKPRRHVHYNCEVQHGFRTKREAQAVADEMNRQHAEQNAIASKIVDDILAGR